MGIKVKSFGCRLNSYESEIIKKHAKAAGLVNFTIINSCAVTAEAERQLQQYIRKTAKDNPQTKIIVTGCASQINSQFYRSMPEITTVVGNKEKMDQETYYQLQNVANEKSSIISSDIFQLSKASNQIVSNFDNRSRVFLQVQNGCNHRCTFCIIPYGRGNSRSVPIGQIIQQAKIFVTQGYKEIVITGVDITDYGSDLPGKPKLGQMLKRLLRLVPEIIRLRLSSIDVAEIDDDLIDLIVNEKRFMPHIHLSLQSGDTMILKRMKRRHNPEQIREFCQFINQSRPEVVFGADLIAGFPTETNEMHNNTMKLVEDLQISHLHVFPYSERSGTPAAKMPQVARELRKKRAKELRELSKTIMFNLQQRLISQKIEVLIEKDGYGKSSQYFDVILSSNHNLNLQVGDIVQCRVNDVKGLKLSATPLFNC